MILKSIGLAAALASVGCVGMDFDMGGQTVKGSGKVITEHRNVSGFTKIDTEGAYDLTVKIGPAAGMDIKGDDNIVKLVKTKVENGTLTISTTKNFRSHKSLTVTITTPRLTDFSLEGAGDVDIDGVKESDFSVAVSGAGDLKANGQTKSLHASLSGTGDMQLFDLHAESVDASLSGTGDMKVYATKHLKASMSGVGDISYKGHPANIEKSSSGVGDINSAD